MHPQKVGILTWNSECCICCTKNASSTSNCDKSNVYILLEFRRNLISEAFLDSLANSSYLSIKQWRVVIDVRYLHSEGTNSFQRWVSIVCCFHCNRDKLSVFTLTIKHLVGCHSSGLRIHGKFSPFLIWLLDNAVAYLRRQYKCYQSSWFPNVADW